jgi:hypothetical protein
MTVSTLDDGRLLYCVYGVGMVFCHEQRWQAQCKLEALRCANGCSERRCCAAFARESILSSSRKSFQ